MAFINLEELAPLERAIMRHSMLWTIELHQWDRTVARKFGLPRPRSTQLLRDAMRIVRGRNLIFRNAPVAVQLWCPDCGAGVGDTLQRIDRCFKCQGTGPWLNSWEKEQHAEIPKPQDR